MRYECYPNDPDRFATNLRRDNRTKNLIWDSAKGQDAIIVQTPFGQSAVSKLDKICESLNTMKELTNKFVEVLDGVWVCYVSATNKARNNGCVLNGEASTYTVFSCCLEGDVVKIYKPQDQAMISSNIDVPLEIHVDITKDTVYEGFFRKREVETGFYCVSFPSELGNGYMDGSLSYQIDGFEIPVTKEVIMQGTVYIKTDVRPVLVPKNRGLRIT